MPLDKREGSPFWYYDFRYAGERYRGSTHTTTKAAAKAFEADLLSTLKNKCELPEKGRPLPLLGDFLSQFSVMIEGDQHLDADTERYYRRGVTLLKNTGLKNVVLDRITKSLVAGVKFPCSAATGNNAIRTLSRAMSYAVELELLHAAPRLKQYAEVPRDQVWSPEQEAKLLAVAPQPLADVFVLLMDLGARPEEVCRLRWKDVLWEENMVRIRRGEEDLDAAKPKRDGKTKAARREVGMSGRVRDVLTRRAREQATNPNCRDTPWIFPSRRKAGAPILNVNKAFADARKEAGLPTSLVLYAARHTFGTEFMRATKDLKLTMTTMGHVDVKTAMRYQHPETGQVASVIDARNAQRKSAVTGKGDRAFGHNFGHSACQPRDQNAVSC